MVEGEPGVEVEGTTCTLPPDFQTYENRDSTMEKTMKPWDVNEKKVPSEEHSQGKTPNSSNKMLECAMPEALLQNMSLPAHKRNPQRDAIRPSTSRPAVSAKSRGGPSKESQILPKQPIHSTRGPHYRPPHRVPDISSNSVRPAQCSHPSSLDMKSVSVPTPNSTLPETSIEEGGNDELSNAPPAYEVTEWTVFLDRIQNYPYSATYEDLLLLEEVNGSSRPQPAGRMTLGVPNRPLNASVGQVEVLHRRTTKEGKSKLKLELAGMRVENCGICLSQFRSGEQGALTDCRHSFHEPCLQRWVAQSASCPVCRLALAPD